MKYIQILCFSLCFASLCNPFYSFTQDTLISKFGFEVNKRYTPLSISKEELTNAKKIEDINQYFKPEWVKKYASVKVSAYKEGIIQSAISDSDILTFEQLEIMDMTDLGTDISIIISYYPDNSLPFDDIKEFSFDFKVNPEIAAQFPGGQKALLEYLDKDAISKISKDEFNEFDLTAVTFTVTKDGLISNVSAFNDGFYKSKYDDIDQILIESICNMPAWKPAQYADGTRAAQSYALSVGNHPSCVLNLLDIRKPF